MGLEDGLDRESVVEIENKDNVRGFESDSNYVFYLYRKVTVSIIRVMYLSIAIFQCTEFGDISCYRGNQCACDEKTLSAYCWVQGTLTVERHHHNKTVGKQMVPHAGMGPILPTDTVTYHSYYIWIIPHLFLADILFSAPWWMWKKYWEGRRITKFMQALNILIVEKPEKLKETKEQLLAYFQLRFNDRVHGQMAIRYITCEVANFLHVLGQLAFTNYLLKGEFTTYGFEAISFLVGDQKSRVDPMTKIFPLVTTCHLALIGPSGDKQLTEGICVMPLNSLFDKIFIVLWFWYLFLAAASTLGLIYRLLTVYCRHFRYILLRWQSSCQPSALQEICKRSTYGDWLLLFTLNNVIDCFFYKEILEALAEKLKDKNVN